MLEFCSECNCGLSLLFTGDMGNIYLNIVRPYRVKIHRRKESSNFSYLSMPSSHSGELTFLLLWKVGAQTTDPSPS